MTTNPHKSAALAQVHSAVCLQPADEATRLGLNAGLSAATDVGRLAIQVDANSTWVWTGALWRHVAGPRPIHTVSGTTYTPTVADLDATVETTGASGVTITLPLITSLVGIKPNDGIEFVQGGAGLLTLAHVSGSTNIKSSGTLVSKGQYSFLFAKYIGSDVWFVTGDRA